MGMFRLKEQNATKCTGERKTRRTEGGQRECRKSGDEGYEARSKRTGITLKRRGG